MWLHRERTLRCDVGWLRSTLFADDLSKEAYAPQIRYTYTHTILCTLCFARVQNRKYRMRLTAYNIKKLGGGKEEGGKRR